MQNDVCVYNIYYIIVTNTTVLRCVIHAHLLYKRMGYTIKILIFSCGSYIYSILF